MADNTPLNTGAGGDTVRSLQRQAGTVKTQVVQLDIGGVTANAESLLTVGSQVSSASLPVVIASDQGPLNVRLASIGNEQLTTGNLTALGQVTTSNFTGISTAIITLANVWTGTVVFEASHDAVTFFAITAINVFTGAISGSTTSNGIFAAETAGYQSVRARCSVFGSGTITVNIRTGFGTSVVSLGAPVTQQAITKGAQGANGVTTQDLKDAGRNQTNYFMATQVVSTATETLQNLTGYKSNAGVAATTTPAVVTASKTYRVNKIVITYVGVITAGAIQVNLRANAAGVVALASPIVDSWLVGAGAATAGVAQTIVINIPDGMEFAAGTGIGITVQGVNATGVAAAAGYAKVSVSGFEY